MKEILTVVFCVFLFVTIVLAILFHERVRELKKFLNKMSEERRIRKEAEEDAYFKRTSNKYYHEEEKPSFKEGYFKGNNEQEKYDRVRFGGQQQQEQKTTARKKVNTSDGVTIVDSGNKPKNNRKIFDADEGEYVDFTEVS